jgi:hypothetical protein
MPLVSSMFAPADVATERMNICKSCPSLTKIKMCRECGCVMPMKVRLRGVQCPLGKWGEVEDDGRQHFVEDAVWEEQEREVQIVQDHFKIKSPLDRR